MGWSGRALGGSGKGPGGGRDHGGKRLVVKGRGGGLGDVEQSC